MGKALLVYSAATAVYTWPLVLHPTSHLAAPVGPGDPYLYLWVFGWVIGTILRSPADVFNGRVFNANIFYPAESTLAYSDHMLLQSAALTPIHALTGNLVFCYNLLFFASLVLSAFAMHAYVRSVTASTSGAYLAGLAWGFWPYRFAHLVHIQLQALYFMPLAFLLCHRVIAGRRMRDALGLGVVMALQALSSAYYGIIGGVGIVVAAGALAIAVGRWRSRSILVRLLVAGFVGAALTAPVAWVYWRVQRDAGFGRSLFEASRNAAAIRSYAQVPPENVAYGITGLLPTAQLEQALFPGFSVLTLAAVGAIRGSRRDARPLVVAMAAVAIAGFVLSLGPNGFRSIYAFLQRYVFGFQAIRAPARFAVLVTFALATLAALGVRELASTRRWRPVAYVALVLSAIEWLNVPMPLAPAPLQQTALGQWLSQEATPGPVVHLPLEPDVESTPAMVQSLEHRRSLINGYSGLRPEFYNVLVDMVSTFPSDEALLALREADARFVITPSPVDSPAADASWPLVERARFADGVVYELRWTPEADARVAAAGTAEPPPEPGPAPFAAGETARYNAFWAGAGVNLAAGEITVKVEPPPYTFVATARTAPWMANFFEAQDTFTTRASPRLMPLVHERDQREGSRQLRRTFVYDHASRVVRIGRDAAAARDEDGLVLPLAEFARDAISAVFYVRTLPLADGDRYRFPVNDAGRSMLVDVTVVGRESVRIDGRDTPAVRLEPHIQRRLERRRPIRATLWLSDDSRRLPLVMEVDAAFGRVRLELTSYDPGS